MTLDPVRLSAPEIADAVRRRRLDPVTVVDAFLGQIPGVVADPFGFALRWLQTRVLYWAPQGAGALSGL